MRHFNSTCSFLSLLSKAVVGFTLTVSTVSLSSCNKSTERTSSTQGNEDATGKGNGGNRLIIAEADVKEIFNTLKPKLSLVFEGLSYLALAEKNSPRSTDLAESPALHKTLLSMIDNGKGGSMFTDLATPDNLVPQKPACRDFRGKPNAAAAVLLEVGGKICFSVDEIRKTSVRNLDKAAEVFVIALATHEFVHHFISTGNNENDEKAAREVQEFVEQQLGRHLEIESKGLVSVDDSAYIKRFHEAALDTYRGTGGH